MERSRGPVRRPVGASVGARTLVAGALLVALAGCGLLDDEDAGSPPDRDVVVARVETLLDQRARAVRADDPEALVATVDPSEPGLVRRQRTYAENLAQLPLTRVRFRLEPGSLERDGDRWTGTVEVRTELRGFDRWPVLRSVEQTFAPGPGDGYLLAGERDDPAGRPPWEHGAVVVRERGGVLGVFDDRSAVHADTVLASVDAGIAQVGPRVPYPWERDVVVYALSDTSALRSVPDLPGGDPDRLDGVSFPVGRRGTGAAATRLVLHPRMLTAPAGERDRLVRHELTHVAVAERDDRSPTWLSEGIAEHVAVQAIPEAERLLARPALVAAADPDLRLPASADFNGAESEANYGVAWWACEALVDLYGEPVLWELLDLTGAAAPQEWDAVLTDRLGITPAALAGEARRRMIAEYGPPG